MNTTKYYRAVIACLAIAVLACSKPDHFYKDLLDDVGKINVGKTTVKAISPGFKRAFITAQVSSDARINTIRISWNSGDAFADFNISKEEIGKEKVFVVDALNDNYYNFQVYSLIDEKTRSIATETSGYVYGDEYQSLLPNRAIKSRELKNTDAHIYWESNADISLLGTQLTYTTNGDITKTLYSPVSVNESVLEDYKTGTGISISSLYKPVANFADTVYSKATNITVE